MPDAAPWAAATFPVTPPPRLMQTGQISVIEDAYLTPFDRGLLRRVGQWGSWMTGAAYDHDGELELDSQRIHAGDVESPVAADPDVVRRRPGARRLEGSWLYAGHWMMHFGHFLVETLSTLWPERDPRAPDELHSTLAAAAPQGLAGLVLHRTYHGDKRRQAGLLAATPRSWQQSFLELAGWGDLPIRVVQGRPIAVDRLVVPQRSVVFKAFATSDAVRAWERVAVAAGAPGDLERVYLSRSAFHRDPDRERRVRSEPAWDLAADTAFAEAGFEVLYPETLALEEQIRLVRGARVLAGASGSALHLSAFCRSGTRVLEVGDTRFTESGATQRVIDTARGHTTAFLPYGDPAGLPAALRALGLHEVPG